MNHIYYMVEGIHVDKETAEKYVEYLKSCGKIVKLDDFKFLRKNLSA